MRGQKPVTETVALPSNGDNLDKCLANIVEGFTQVRARCPAAPVAISFAFPGPVDYPAGIVGDLFEVVPLLTKAVLARRSAVLVAA